ncbi:MAG: tRNA (adenosine(37)-N6)-threonylcarbamoyltransferase complex ATPase subunit type 1 TsaE [Candidatus Peribacteraceae bacterium]|jgi:tRNA threonylcarbamoyladenosine biosynthesis protein TsaE
MSIPDSCSFSLPNAESTVHAGASLAHTLYRMPLTLLLRGELGAGKTTFFQGFAQGLGVHAHVMSPTFALEQRYATRELGELLHIDLYRLHASQARELLAATDDHRGIRCIEWPERLEMETEAVFPDAVSVSLSDEPPSSRGKDGRLITVDFRDIPLPTLQEIAQWRTDVLLPTRIIAHSHTVGLFAKALAVALWGRHTIARPATLLAAGELHDLLRFVDFRALPHTRLFTPTPEQEERWTQWRKRYAGLTHEEAAATFLREKGFAALGEIVSSHGLRLPSPSRITTEQKVLFYADKRVQEDAVVSLRARFDDFRNRYGENDRAASKEWFEEAKRLEQELFPDGVPY